jgi:hypothetical protein
LDPPVAYILCLYERGESLQDAVPEAVEKLARDPEVDRVWVVFIYSNHETPDHFDLITGENLRSGTFRYVADEAAEAGREILFVLDACDSGILARSIWKQLEGTTMERDGFTREKSVGFLHSGDGTSHRSAPVVSRETALVYPLPGYRGHNSMVGRSLIWTTAYGMPDQDVSLSALPALLNGLTPGSCGFEAEFLGEPTLFGSRRARDFFPWAQADGNLSLRGRAGIRMTDLVPSEPIGELFDDLVAIGEKEWNGTNFEDRFVEIATVDERVEIVKTGGTDELGVGEWVTRSLFGRPPFGRDHLHVPLSFIYFRLSDLAEGEGMHPHVSPQRDDDDDDNDTDELASIEELRELQCFLHEIIGPVRRDEWGSLGELAAWGLPMSGSDRFRRKISEIRNELAEEEEEEELARQREGQIEQMPTRSVL